jgi:hypothetical protein
MALTVPFAYVSDLEDRWRPLTSDEQNRAEVLIDDASQLILDSDLRGIFADAVDPASLTLVRTVCAMVKRAMSAPVDLAPVSQMQETTGPFGVTATYSNPAGDLYLSSAERRALGFSTQRASNVPMWSPPEDA